MEEQFALMLAKALCRCIGQGGQAIEFQPAMILAKARCRRIGQCGQAIERQPFSLMLASKRAREHEWRTREDPFHEVWDEVAEQLEANAAMKSIVPKYFPMRRRAWGSASENRFQRRSTRVPLVLSRIRLGSSCGQNGHGAFDAHETYNCASD